MNQEHRSERAMSAALFLLKVFGIALLGYAVVMFLAQRRLIYPGAARDSTRSAASAPAGVRQIWLEPSFGRVEAWYFEAEGEGRAPTVVFAHGNGELIDDWQVEMERLRAEGVGVLLVEFPGYGYSEGMPSRAAIRETFTSAYDWLVDSAGVDPERIVAYGRSLGGGAAADLVMDRPLRALVLQSSFTSTADMARSMLLPGFLVRDRFDPRRTVRDFAGPVLLLHGIDDDVIPYAHSEALASMRDGLQVITLDCAHNDCGPQWPFIIATLTEFLGTHGFLDRPGAGSRS